MDRRPALGRVGEDLACEALRQRGYVIVERRFRTRTGEIDIVARDGPTMVFIEVKGRAGESSGAPAEAVTARKRRRLGHVALEYLARHRLTEAGCRFDVVTVTWAPDGMPQVTIIPGAFTLNDR